MRGADEKSSLGIDEFDMKVKIIYMWPSESYVFDDTGGELNRIINNSKVIVTIIVSHWKY
jgi:hypothetical protein